jgi:hypothetical protein
MRRDRVSLNPTRLEEKRTQRRGVASEIGSFIVKTQKAIEILDCTSR